MCNSLPIFSFCLLLYFFAMSFSVSAHLVSDYLAQSQAASSIDLHDTSFNLSEKTSSTIFQNIQKYSHNSAPVSAFIMNIFIAELNVFGLKAKSLPKL